MCKHDRHLTCLIYRDRILPPSEHVFMRAQYCNFTSMQRYFLGRHKENPPSFVRPFHIIGNSSIEGWLRRAFFKKLGWGADRFIKRIRPDILHGQFATSARFILPLAKRYQLPVVLTCHGADVFKRRNARIFQRLSGALRKYVYAFIAVTPRIHEQLRNLDIAEHMIIDLPIGVADEGRVATYTEPPLLLMASRLTLKKGHLLFLEALALLKKRGLCPKVVIAGDGPLKKEIMRQASNKDLRNVEFRGWIDQNELHELFRQSRSLISPSIIASNGDEEGWPTITKQAMMAGVPIIATRSSNIPSYVLKETGNAEVMTHDPQELARAIEKQLFLSKNAFMHISQLSRDYALKYLNQKHLSHTLEQILTSIALTAKGYA